MVQTLVQGHLDSGQLAQVRPFVGGILLGMVNAILAFSEHSISNDEVSIKSGQLQ
jgi:hypothetical protein